MSGQALGHLCLQRPGSFTRGKAARGKQQSHGAEPCCELLGCKKTPTLDLMPPGNKKGGASLRAPPHHPAPPGLSWGSKCPSPTPSVPFPGDSLLQSRDRAGAPRQGQPPALDHPLAAPEPICTTHPVQNPGLGEPRVQGISWSKPHIRNKSDTAQHRGSRFNGGGAQRVSGALFWDHPQLALSPDGRRSPAEPRHAAWRSKYLSGIASPLLPNGPKHTQGHVRGHGRTPRDAPAEC